MSNEWKAGKCRVESAKCEVTSEKRESAHRFMLEMKSVESATEKTNSVGVTCL